MDRVIHLRVDVDFNEGLKKGVPFLLRLFADLGIKATFYVVMGPDTLHRHLMRVRSKAFRRRMSSLKFRKVLRHLGWAYLKSHFLNLQVAGGNIDLLKEIERQGHNLGAHGYDHALWADRVFEMSEEETFLQMDMAFSRFQSLLGRAPTTWGAPNWRSNEHMFSYLERKGVAFSSDTRGVAPFFPVVKGRSFKVLELPITLPCIHELVQHGCRRAEIPLVMERCLRPEFNLLCIHDYYEGLLDRDLFRSCLERLLAGGWTFRPLHELAGALDGITIATDELLQVLVPGGVGPISCQGRFLEDNYFQALAPAGSAPGRWRAAVPSPERDR